MGRPFKKRQKPEDTDRTAAEPALSPAAAQAEQRTRLEWYAALEISCVEIVPLPDACPSCLALEGMRWPIEQAQARQPLPHQGCTRRPCRCIYLPVP